MQQHLRSPIATLLYFTLQWGAGRDLLFFYDDSRQSDDGTVVHSELYYRCNRVLADLFYADDLSKRRLEFTKRYIVMDKVSRHVQPRSHADRRKLQKLPIFLYNSAPERNVLDELKDKV